MYRQYISRISSTQKLNSSRAWHCESMLPSFSSFAVQAGIVASQARHVTKTQLTSSLQEQCRQECRSFYSACGYGGASSNPGASIVGILGSQSKQSSSTALFQALLARLKSSITSSSPAPSLRTAPPSTHSFASGHSTTGASCSSSFAAPAPAAVPLRYLATSTAPANNSTSGKGPLRHVFRSIPGSSSSSGSSSGRWNGRGAAAALWRRWSSHAASSPAGSAGSVANGAAAEAAVAKGGRVKTAGVSFTLPHALTMSEALAAGVPNHLRRQLAWWMGGTAAWVYTMVVLGGVTRLTRSGLSMTDWKFTGERPPLTDEHWQEEFAKYKLSPEFKKLHPNMTLEDFKFIFWMEYAHRMWGRLLGIAFVLPAMYFAARGAINQALAKRLGLLFTMGGTQGLVGWWMVRSGLDEPTEEWQAPRVSPYRLAAHLVSAFTIFATLAWTAMDLR
ncbi:cytochrome oxidase assembly protein-domain-containing protein, partial [Dunaliella salina]